MTYQQIVKTILSKHSNLTINNLLEEGKKRGCYKIALLCNKGLEKFYLESDMKTQKKVAMEHVFEENFTY